MTTYTVIDQCSGEKIYGGLTAEDAAHIVLTDDGWDFDIREDEGGGFTLWRRRQVVDRDWRATAIWSFETDRAAAEAEIFEKVINTRWPRHPEVVTDERYEEQLAAFENDGE
jgi:hypothetical protein